MLIKKTILILCVVFLAATAGVQGQHRFHSRRYTSPVERASLAGVEYHNISRTWQKIDLAGKNTLIFAPVVHGVAFTTGHNFLIHERPLWRIVHFGFDATWFDIEYANWRRHIDGHGKWMHKLDMAVGAGPAIHLSPFGRFGIHAYFHYNPTFSLVTHNFASYASYFSTGLALSWDIFSLGGEYRHGGGTYHGIRIPDVTISPEHIDELIGLDLKDALDRQRHRMSGWRIYLSFRF